jgi:hypothetical protein
MDHFDQIFQMVKQYDSTQSVEGKEYLVRKMRNTFRYINKPEQKLTIALFVVLELNRTRQFDLTCLVEKITCLTNLDKKEVFDQLPLYMADYLTSS